MNRPFSELLQQVINGSDEAARILFEQYRRPLLYVIRRRLNQKLRAQFDSVDIAQDVWASFFSESLEKRGFQSSDQLIAFLTTLAKNKVIDNAKLNIHGRKRDVSRDFSMDDSRQFDKDGLPGSDATPSQIIMSREEWNCFLRKQPPVYREIFLRLRDGKTQQEIAAELHISERMIRQVMNRLAPEATSS